MNRWMAEVMREGVSGETDQMLLILSCGLYTTGLVVFDLNAALREHPVIFHHLIHLRHLRLKCVFMFVLFQFKGILHPKMTVISSFMLFQTSYVRIGMT